MHRILLVDDEPNALNALQRELRGRYEIEAHHDPVAALQRCRATAFDLVVVDYQMPTLNGVEFLKQFVPLQPEAISVMLSGQADFDALLGSINETHIYRFIAKPWDPTELATTLAEALAHRELVLENRRLADLQRQQQPWQRPRDPNHLYQVLVVDDDPIVLGAIRHDLAERGGFNDLHTAMLSTVASSQMPAHRDLRFHVTIHQSPRAALEQARSLPFDVVICDYTMPEMDGLQFLGTMRELQADAVRILLADDADKEMLVRAINGSEIYSVLIKPWSQYSLRSILSEAAEYHDLLRENRLLAELARS